MNINNTLTYERARELLEYDADTGALSWRRPRKGVKTDRMVGSLSAGTKGYRRIGVDGHIYRAHRLAWLLFHGVWPEDQIDHINGNRDDNRIVNLRESNNSGNQENRSKARSDNKLGLLGVIWSKQSRKYQANIVVRGKQKHLGFFLDANDAHAAYVSAKRQLHAGNTL